MANEKTIDLSILDSIPEYKETNEVDEFELSSESTDEIKEFVIEEVNSLKEFSDEEKKEVVKDKSDSTEVETDIQESEVEIQEEEKAIEGEISPIRALSEWAGSKRLIDFDPEKFEDKEEYLETKFQEVIKKGIEDYKKELPEEVHTLINNYQEGVPLDELIYSRSREIEYKSLKEDSIKDNKDLQKRLVSEWMRASDSEATAEEIDSEIQKLEDALLLEDKAVTSWKKLTKFEEKYQEQLVHEAKEIKERTQKEFDQRLKSLEKEIMDSEEIIPGIKLSKEDRQKLFEGYTKVDSKRKTALLKAMENDPKANLKVAQLFLLMEGKLDSVKGKLTTEAVNKVKNKVTTYTEESPLNKVNIQKIAKALKISQNQRKI
jgi:hypothetical protein